MNTSLKNIVSSLSLALDLTDSINARFENIIDDKLNINDSKQKFTNHSLCTTYIALEIGLAMNIGEDRLFDLYIASMIHDIGAQNILDCSHTSAWYIKKHCIDGADMIQKIPCLIQVHDIIKYHHENYDGTGTLKVKNSLVPIEAQILRLSDLIAIQIDFNSHPLIQNNKIINWVKHLSGKVFSPDITDVFLKVSRKESFWLNIYNIPMNNSIISPLIPNKDVFISLEEFEPIADVFASIIDNKSSFTAEHSKEIARLAYAVSKYLNYNEEKCLKMKIAGLLHDLGKLAVPTAILDKPGPLSDDEYSVIKSHTYYTRLILSKINDIDDICKWASSHHEKLNGTGYPEKLDSSYLTDECEIICVCDIYQSLTADRPYRKGMYMYEAFDILDDMVNKNYISEKAVNALKSTLISHNEK